ncbi:MAG: ribose 5-phosphate isomerase B [Campylobacter sp.]|uniref:ribose 5-phosphate isomerase B n=1 Tax=Campylobacter sp. TaxID=205 RepID=UPI001B7B97CA|nr:ribose 5-phosphate isomerase B [Campylobacter sp.]MBP3675037.1 ribose 5-phosphate isomerase B [Campylobacter sp.]MBR2148918.1 ribose 5-phosphate isomerase B [Campylobacter sp.]MBR2159453.1 ribose 5-phosphate isomerase B [Campylobacter sp.]MBR2917275.1 ribose 5-phosphate isomerase B [Campylobacter sp.]
MNISQVYIASDHAGYEAKMQVKSILENMGVLVIDLGTDNAKNSVDYPDFAALVANSIKSNDEFGVLICGSGIGISIAANRFSHIRCALGHNATIARLSREHNDANVLCFGARVVGDEVIKDMVEVFFTTEFSGGRHQKRVEKLGVCQCS